MNPQMRRDVFRAVLPALAGGVLMAALWLAHDYAYDSLCPGVLGDWQIRIGAVPCLFWFYKSGPLTIASEELFIPWVLACAFFVAGPLVAFMFSRGKAAHFLSTALLLGVITHGCVNVVSFLGLVMWFSSMPATPVNVALGSLPWVAWIFALSLGGAVIGIAAQRIYRFVGKQAPGR